MYIFANIVNIVWLKYTPKYSIMMSGVCDPDSLQPGISTVFFKAPERQKRSGLISNFMLALV